MVGKLIYLADAMRQRGYRVRRSGWADPETRVHVAGMLVTAFLIVLGWVAVQGLDESHRCPGPRQFTCFR